MNSLRDLQYEYNRRKSAMMEVDYKRKLELPTIRWTINEGDILCRRKEVELSKLYRDAYLGWEEYYEGAEFERFGTAPVRDTYWSLQAHDTPGMRNGKPCIFRRYSPKKPKKVVITSPEISQHFNSKLLNTPTPKMIFRRFDNLLSPEEQLDILVQSLLGFHHQLLYNPGNHCAILDDSWTVNLRSTQEKENIMMDSFLRGFGGQSEE